MNRTQAEASSNPRAWAVGLESWRQVKQRLAGVHAAAAGPLGLNDVGSGMGRCRPHPGPAGGGLSRWR